MMSHFPFTFASFLMNFMIFWRSLSHDCDLGNHDKAKDEGRFRYSNPTEKRRTSPDSARRDDSFSDGFSLLACLQPKIRILENRFIRYYFSIANLNSDRSKPLPIFSIYFSIISSTFWGMKKHFSSSIFAA